MQPARIGGRARRSPGDPALRTPGGDPALRTPGGARVVVLVLALVGVLGLALAGATTDDPDPGDRAAAGDGSIELVRPEPPAAGSPEASAEERPADGGRSDRPPVCRRSDRGAGACGPRLVDRDAPAAEVVPLDAGSVLLGRRGELLRVEVATGSTQWRSTPLPGILHPRIAAHPTTVLVSSPDVVAAVDAMSGRVRWRTFLSTPAPGRDDPPKAAAQAWMFDGGALVLDGWEQLHALDPVTGEVRWSERDAGGSPVAGVDGVVTTHDGRLRGWDPVRPGPRWEHTGSGLLWDREEVGLRIRPPRHDASLTGPVPLVGGRELLDLRTGDRIQLPTDGVIRTEVLPEVTVVQRWPGGDAPLEVTAYGAGTRPLWQRTDLPIPCCLTLALGSASETFALAPAPRERAVILRLDDGSTVRQLDREGATLVSITDRLAIWRTGSGLVGEHLATGREAFRATGAVRSTEPLLLSGPGGILAITGASSAPPDIGRARERRLR